MWKKDGKLAYKWLADSKKTQEYLSVKKIEETADSVIVTISGSEREWKQEIDKKKIGLD